MAGLQKINYQGKEIIYLEDLWETLGILLSSPVTPKEMLPEME
ncbi:MAG: hypothetical protein ABJH98_05680 [Reichenbachiella sp.]